MRPITGKPTRRGQRRAWRGHSHPHLARLPRFQPVRLDRHAPNPRIPWRVDPGDGSPRWYAISEGSGWMQLEMHREHRNSQPV
jgi:hypothetical protein